MKIDIYAHLIPPRFKDMVAAKNPGLATAVRTLPPIYDLNIRFRIMDRYPDVAQVLSFPGATVDELAEPGKAVDLAQEINDEMAELVYKYPERFASAIAVLPVSDIDASLKEIDRAINDLKMRGILLRVPINGKPVDRPEFFPVYEKMCQHNLPIWFHPHRSPKVPDYPDEKESKYMIWHLWGLVHETTVSMTCMVMSGTMQRFPTLKIITHHCGAMVPYFGERIVNHYFSGEVRRKAADTVGLTEEPVEYFRRFYNDTAILGNTPALMCGYSFFGADRILFGTDAPYDARLGDYGTPHTIKAIEAMAIPDADKEKIFSGNARKLLRLPV